MHWLLLSNSCALGRHLIRVCLRSISATKVIFNHQPTFEHIGLVQLNKMRLDVSIRHGCVNLQHYPELIPSRVVNVLSVMRNTINVFHLRAKTKIVKLLQK